MGEHARDGQTCRRNLIRIGALIAALPPAVRSDGAAPDLIEAMPCALRLQEVAMGMADATRDG